MTVLKYGNIRKYTCPSCDSMLGYTNEDIYTKESCNPTKVYKRFIYVGPERTFDFSKESVTIFYIKCPVCGREIELFSMLSSQVRKRER